MHKVVVTLGAVLIAVVLTGDRNFISASTDDVVRPRAVTVPAGTTLPIVLDSYVASDTSRLEDTVTGNNAARDRSQ